MNEIREKAIKWVDVVKIGRTHLQDATPLTVGQEWSGYMAQLNDSVENIKQSMKNLYKLAAGGTAVGTGLNSLPDFGSKIAAEIARLTNHPFISAPNKFAAQGSLDGMVHTSAALRGLAVALMKIANDIRWLACGPRAGLHELNIPSNEPGSSIMPGKVNPTQEEAMIMVCIQVIGNDNVVAIAGSQGNFELNAMRPIIIKNVLQSSSIIGDACDKLRRYSIEGITLDQSRIRKYVNESLMLVTALSPVIGYDKASAIAHKALDENKTLREAAIETGYISAEEFDKIVIPENMVGNPHKDLDV
jgi:fumarate hydratase class II